MPTPSGSLLRSWHTRRSEPTEVVVGLVASEHGAGRGQDGMGHGDLRPTHPPPTGQAGVLHREIVLVVHPSDRPGAQHLGGVLVSSPTTSTSSFTGWRGSPAPAISAKWAAVTERPCPPRSRRSGPERPSGRPREWSGGAAADPPTAHTPPRSRCRSRPERARLSSIRSRIDRASQSRWGIDMPRPTPAPKFRGLPPHPRPLAISANTRGSVWPSTIAARASAAPRPVLSGRSHRRQLDRSIPRASGPSARSRGSGHPAVEPGSASSSVAAGSAVAARTTGVNNPCPNQVRDPGPRRARRPCDPAPPSCAPR